MNHYASTILLISFFMFQISGKAQEVKPYFTSATSGTKTTVVKVKKSFRASNEDYVTFIDSTNKKIKLNAAEVIDYYDGENKHLLFTDSEGNKKLLSYKAYGNLTFAESFDKKGNLKFYIIKDTIAVNLDKGKYNLNAYFGQYLKDDKPFMDSYKRIQYDYQAIGNFISAYNVYKNPEKYAPSSYRSKHFYNYSAFVGSFLGDVEFESLKIKFNQRYAYSAGAELQMNFNRLFSLYGSLFYDNAAFIYDSELNHSNMTWHSGNFDFIPAVTLFQKGNVFVRLGPGLGVKGILSGNIDRYINIYGIWDNTNFNNIRFVSSGHLIISFNDRFAIKATYRDYSILINDYIRIGNTLSGAKGSCKTFSLTLQYSLFKRYTEII
jgi:hypothetical protein